MVESSLTKEQREALDRLVERKLKKMDQEHQEVLAAEIKIKDPNVFQGLKSLLADDDDDDDNEPEESQQLNSIEDDQRLDKDNMDNIELKDKKPDND